jgi:hypothetical protein
MCIIMEECCSVIPLVKGDFEHNTFSKSTFNTLREESSNLLYKGELRCRNKNNYQ